MCGIFGLIRTSSSAEAAARSTAAFLSLGSLSEERGTDSSGIAAYNPGRRKSNASKVTDALAASPALVIDNVTIVRETTRFSKMNLEEHLSTILNAQVLIGHTRWATQGATDDIRNSSPMLAGTLIGTHNGDVEVKSIPDHKTHEANAFGGTDSERLYLALAEVHTDRREITKVLKAVKGRAALVFMDRTRPNHLYIARTALSPVSYAFTEDGDFMYASNPDWFRQIENASKGTIRFTDITLVPEGHLLTLDTRTGEITDIRRFTPTCRERDVSMINSAAYKKFTPEDRAAFTALHRHKIAQTRLPKWPSLTPAPIIEQKPGRDEEAQPALFDEWAFQAGQEDLPAGFEYDDLPPLSVVEDLCWAGGDFDHITYESILRAEDEEDAIALVEALKADVEEMITNQTVAPDFTMPEWFSEREIN